MWRLRVAEGGGPWPLESRNNFLGRSVWEFDPDLGTADERAEVERLREEFTRNRFRRRQSGDRLLALQYANQGHLQQKLPPVKLEENEQVTEEIALISMRRALDRFAALQAPDGHWPGDLNGAMFVMPGWIFALHVTGALNTIITPEHRREICRCIYNHQNEDGGWGSLVAGPSNMYGSCANYIALRLLGEEPNDKNNALDKGQAWILSHGGPTALPLWGKIWLSMIGLYDWSGVNPIFPELWLVPKFLPIHPGRFWCICRMVFLPMAYLYGKRFVGPITTAILDIREELYSIPYEQVKWDQARCTCAKEDIVRPRSLVQDVLWTCLYKCVEPILTRWPISKLRERAVSNLMEHIHYEDETSHYVGLCVVNKILNMVCCWVESPNSYAFKRHLARVYDFFWLSEDGMKSQVINGCQSWEIPFTIQAFCSTDLVDEYSLTLDRAYAFLKNSQILTDHPGDLNHFHRHRSKGSWTFSTADNGWSVSDCSGEALQALLLVSKVCPNLISDRIERQRLYDAADCLLSYVNKDGSVSTYECSRNVTWIEILNPCESAVDITTDYPYPECTSSVLQGLALFKELYPGYRRKEIEEVIRNAAMFIENSQREDGSWYGCWGVCFTYGTFFSVKGLLVAGRTYENSSCIRKACNFVLSKQLKTGGWGESNLSNETREYVCLGDRANAVNTAWGMLTLIYAGQMERDATPIHRAAKELISMQLETGEFPQQEHVGCFNGSFFFNYPSYRNLYPIWALGEYCRQLRANKKTNGCI